jgi:hypothetical protein
LIGVVGVANWHREADEEVPDAAAGAIFLDGVEVVFFFCVAGRICTAFCGCADAGAIVGVDEITIIASSSQKFVIWEFLC